LKISRIILRNSDPQLLFSSIPSSKHFPKTPSSIVASLYNDFGADALKNDTIFIEFEDVWPTLSVPLLPHSASDIRIVGISFHIQPKTKINSTKVSTLFVCTLYVFRD